MAIIDPEGLFNGDRLRRCSNAAQLHWSRLFLAANGFGRLEINYAKIVGTVYPTFNPIPSETELHSFIREYIENYLLFPYVVDGRLWGQWDTRQEFLPRYKTAIDRRSPAPPEPAFTEWKKSYRSQDTSFPKCFETFLHGVGVGVGVGVGKNICASNDARLDERPSIHEPPFGTDLDPLPVEVEGNHNHFAGKTEKRPRAEGAHTKPGEFTPDQETWWSEFWPEFWLKRGKKDARKSFAKAIKAEPLFRKVMVAVRAQKPEMLQREPDKRPYASTWINGERWEDEVETKPAAPVYGSVQPYDYTPPTNLLTDDQIAAERARKRAQMETKSA